MPTAGKLSPIAPSLLAAKRYAVAAYEVQSPLAVGELGEDSRKLTSQVRQAQLPILAVW